MVSPSADRCRRAGEGQLRSSGLRAENPTCRGTQSGDLTAVATVLNTRPGKTLDWRTPAEAIKDQLALAAQTGVASTP
jgi:hypothetical protein